MHAPVNWVLGQDVLVAPDIPTELALQNYPGGVRQVQLPSGRTNVRITPDPGALEGDDENPHGNGDVINDFCNENAESLDENIEELSVDADARGSDENDAD